MTRRTIIVTGGATGIGRATAERYIADGERVAIVDVDGERAATTADALDDEDALAFEADVSDEAAARDALVQICEALGDPDVLVNNAGVAQNAVPINDQSIDEWQSILDVHLRGTYIWSRLVLPGMIERGDGHVVNLSSIAGISAFPYRTAYGPAKAAINNLTEVLAIESAPSGVSVNAVAPGYVRTEMVEDLIENGELDPEPLRERTPAGELATPDQIADAISFLTSPAAGYITGVVLPVDGGWSAYGHV